MPGFWRVTTAIIAALLLSTSVEAQNVRYYPSADIPNPFLIPSGAVSAPSFGFTDYPTSGIWSSSGHFMFQGQRASGTDQGSTGIYFTSGIGTGTGVGGNISFNIAPPGSSGSSLNATTTAFFVFGGASPYYQLGGMDGATAGGSVIDGVDVKAGVTDGAGGRLDIRGGKGTGAGTPGVVTIQTSKPNASGTTQQTLYTTHLTFNESVGVLFTTAYTFATLPSAPQNGSMVYCSDCTKATPCAGSGSGAFAKRIAGAWDCN